MMQSKNPNTSKIPVGRLPGSSWAKRNSVGGTTPICLQAPLPKAAVCQQGLGGGGTAKNLRHEVCTNRSADLKWVGVVENIKHAINSPTIPTN